MKCMFFDQPNQLGAYYRLKVRGILAQAWLEPLYNLELQQEGNLTILIGYMDNRMMLYNLLTYLRRLGFPALWVQRLPAL